MARARKAELASRVAAQKLEIRPGDKVLLGRPGTSRPMDWFMATVLLVTGGEIATEHNPPSNGGAQRQFLPIEHVRAVSSDYQQLFLFRRRCHEALAEQNQKINEAERALGAARDEMWVALDGLSASAPQRLDPAAA